MVKRRRPSRSGQLEREGRSNARRAGAWLGLLGLVVLLPGCIGADRSPSPLPSFDLPDLERPAVRRTSALLLGTPFVMNVFASTCVPCKRELPMLNRVARDVAPQVAFLGVDQLEFRPQGLEFVHRLGVTFPVAHDEAGDLVASLQLAGLPTTIFVDAQGRERSRTTGPITERDLRHQIHALLR